MSVSNHATVLVSDRNLIVPTVQVALQLAEAGRNLTDVIIVTGGLSSDEIETLRETLTPQRVTLLDSSEEISSLLKEFDFGDNHYTPTSLARLLLDDILPAQYEHILYIDGDTYVTGDLTKLFRLRVPSGQIGAALDSLFLHIGGTSEFSSKLREYRRKFGAEEPENYFNAGILAAERATWKSFGPQALEFYRKNYEDCIYHDQSGLNVVCKNAVHWISPENNFSTDFRLMGFQLYVKPRIFHFSGATKPWNSRINPWPLRIHSAYQALLSAHSGLSSFMTRPNPDQKRRLRNRLIAHIVNDAPGLTQPTRMMEKHAFFRRHLETHHFAA